MVRRGVKVHNKNLRGDSDGRLNLRGKGLKAVYKRLENRPVLFPVSKAPHREALSQAVIAVVDPKK